MAKSSTFAIVSTRHFSWYNLLIVALVASHVSALSYVAGGECEAKCSDSVAGTVHDDVVCFDSQYSDLPAKYLKECISCQLNSTAVDTTTNTTDVQWGLFHLRYALSNCMFAYPDERVSISSPCQVTCAPLKRAVMHGIANSTTATNFSADLGFCTGGQFDHGTLNNCAFCYSFIPQQLILGNFLQALHIACYSAPVVGKTFYPDAAVIFNQSTIAGPTGQTPTPVSKKLSGQALIFAIVLPTIVGALLIAGACCGCWFLTRQRKERMAASGRMLKAHDGQFSEYSPTTPRTPLSQAYLWQESEQEMRTISKMPKTADHPVAESPGEQQYLGFALGQWSAHDQIDTPTIHAGTGRQGVRNDSGVVRGDTKDPFLHERYLGSNE